MAGDKSCPPLFSILCPGPLIARESSLPSLFTTGWGNIRPANEKYLNADTHLKETIQYSSRFTKITVHSWPELAGKFIATMHAPGAPKTEPALIFGNRLFIAFVFVAAHKSGDAFPRGWVERFGFCAGSGAIVLMCT